MTKTNHTASYYAATANPSPERSALAGDVSCDVCVIGAGFAGLSAALHLAEAGRRVVVLEAARVGFGASGRNGGQLVNGYSRGYDAIRSRYGEDTARALLNMSFEGAEIIRERVSRYAISCDLKPGGFFAAFTQRQMHELERQKETWEMAGHKTLKMFSGAEVRKSVVATDIYCGGMLDPLGGHIHPLNLALGQASAVEGLGGRIFEQSRALRIERGGRPVVHTAGGRVTADFVIVCGNAYLGREVPELHGQFMPVSSQIVTTEVLGPEMTGAMMPSGYCVEDCNYFLDYYRITGDHRLLFGGGVVYGGTDPADIRRKLMPNLFKTFPQMKDVRLDFAWSGNFALTLTRMPHVGRLADNVYFAHGDSGHGVTTTHLLGRLIAASIQGQSERFDVFASMKNYPFPGGHMFRVPLTMLGAWYYRVLEKLGL